MLAITSLTKRYGSLTALNDVSLSIAPGEFLGLLGPNGAGKSTLMSLIAGLKPADAGNITLDGQPIGARTRHRLGLVPQSIALYEELSAEENLTIFGRLFGLDRATLHERIEDALRAVGLLDRRRDLVGTFSGGMQRRLNLIAALLHRPDLLLCDEPTVGVDPQSRNAIFEFLQQRNAEGLTVIYSTHYMEEATKLCSRIAIIDHGQILADGPLNRLLEQLPFEEEITFPAGPATAPLLAALQDHGSCLADGDLQRFQPHADYPLSAFYQATEALDLPPRLFIHQRPTLEAVFLHLTGRALRD